MNGTKNYERHFSPHIRKIELLKLNTEVYLIYDSKVLGAHDSIQMCLDFPRLINYELLVCLALIIILFRFRHVTCAVGLHSLAVSEASCPSQRQ